MIDLIPCELTLTQPLFMQMYRYRLPVTSPHGNFATVTLPHKLRHMVTSPHFEKVRGDVGMAWKCVGVWGEEGEMWEEV